MSDFISYLTERRNKMKKSIADLAKELLKKNQYAERHSAILVEDESKNEFLFVFDGTGYNEYTQHIFKCHSDLFERPVMFHITTISDSFDFRPVEYDGETVSKHEEILRHAIELALLEEPEEE